MKLLGDKSNAACCACLYFGGNVELCFMILLTQAGMAYARREANIISLGWNLVVDEMYFTL